MVKFLLDHKFEVAKFGQFDQTDDSPVVGLVHNNVSMQWFLRIYPNGLTAGGTEYRSNCAVFAVYKDGPKEKIRVSLKIYLLNNLYRRFYATRTVQYSRGSESCEGVLMPDIKALVGKNCLSDMNTVLHIQVELEIQANTFDDPNNKFQVRLSEPLVNMDFYQNFFREDFKTINNEANDDDDRFEVISQDKRHFWVHKYIMIKRSSLFIKAMFKPESGNKGHMKEWHENRVFINGVSGESLEQILHYMYMGYVNELTDHMVKEVLSFASMHSLDDLKAICVNKLHEKKLHCMKIYVLNNLYRRYRNDKRQFLCSRANVCEGVVMHDIPVGFDALVAKNCLSDMNTVLHIQVELEIPSDAFDDPDNQFQVRLSEPIVSMDFYQDFFREEFKTINNEAGDDGDRFEVISQDKRHFWVHKYIMIKRSPLFKAMFKPESGNQGHMKEWHENRVFIEDVSGESLEQILHYMYMGYANELTDHMVIEVLSFVSMHFLDDLKAICVEKLLEKSQRSDLTVDQVVELSIESEKYELKEVKENCISYFAKRWIEAMDKGCFTLNLLFTDQMGKAFLRDLFTAIEKKLN